MRGEGYRFPSSSGSGPSPTTEQIGSKERAVEASRKLATALELYGFDAEGWIFPTEDGKPIFYANFLRRVWRKVQDIAKVRRRTPHDSAIQHQLRRL